MIDEVILAEFMAASPTFAAGWRLTESYYPPSDPETLPSALYHVASCLRGLLVRDRHRELGPLLAALERTCEAATPTQREHFRRCVIETLVHDCRVLGLDPALFQRHLGPQCRVAWSETERM